MLKPEAHGRLAELAQAALPNEAGGVLIGWYGSGELHVTDAIGVDDPNAGPSSYERTNLAANKALRAYLASRSNGDPSGYVGEWHSHPAAVGPSPVDKLSFLNIAAKANRPLAMIVVVRQEDGWEPMAHTIGPVRWPRRRSKGMT